MKAANHRGSSWQACFRGGREQRLGQEGWDEQSEGMLEGQDMQVDGSVVVSQGPEGDAPFLFRDQERRLAAAVRILYT